MADTNIVLSTFTSSAISVAIINWLKASKYFPWITKERTALLRAFSVIAASASGVGINYLWNPTDHSIVVSGLTLANGGALAWAILRHFAMNETIFQATKPQRSQAEVVAADANAASVKAGMAPHPLVLKPPPPPAPPNFKP
jgi:hypothetical protein